MKTHCCRRFLVLLLALFAQPSVLTAQDSTWPVKLKDVPTEEAIGFCLYTVHDQILKLTAQLYPLADGVDRTVVLQILQGDQWAEAAATTVSEERYGFPQENL